MWKSAVCKAPRKIKIGHWERCLAHQSAAGGQPTGTVKETKSPSSVQLPDQHGSQGNRKKGYLGKILGVSILAVGGAAGYAWYNEDFRGTITTNVPYSKDVLDAVFSYLPDSLSVPAPFISEDRQKKISVGNKEPLIDIILPSKKDLEKPVTQVKSVEKPLVQVKPRALDDKKKEDKQENEDSAAVEIQRNKAAEDAEIQAENAAIEIILESQLEVCEYAVKKAKQMEEKIISLAKRHNTLLKNAMEDNSTGTERDQIWQDVSLAAKAVEEASKTSEQAVNTAKENLEKLHQAIDKGLTNFATKKNKIVFIAKEKLDKLNKEIKDKHNEVIKSEAKFRMMAHYKELAEKGKQQFRDEIRSVIPDIKIGKGKKFSEDELNILIAHAHKRIEQLQTQLAQKVALENERFENGLKKQRAEDKKLFDNNLKEQQEKWGESLAEEKLKWEAEAQAQFEIELRRQYRMQTAAHHEDLMQQTEILRRSFEHQLEQQIINERMKFDMDLSACIGRLRGIEKALNDRAENDLIATKAQELWLACVALHGAICVGNDKNIEQLVPLEKVVEALFSVSRNNPFVGIVLESIPETALKRGVYTEEALKEQFVKVKKVAQRVALIDETGGSPLKYFWSYLQSVFVYKYVYAKDKTDVVDINKLDTFQICSHASYWIEKGDLEQAVRFMNQLEGQAKMVASDWVQEVRLYLEAKQASKALMAFASATGLGTIF